MRGKLRKRLVQAANGLELAVGAVILVGCVAYGVGLLLNTDYSQLLASPTYFQARLSDACLIIIGIELIKMFTSYQLDSVVDVLLLAIARQVVVEHTAPLENLLAVLAVGILFVVRKYLYISRLDRNSQDEDEVHTESGSNGNEAREQTD